MRILEIIALIVAVPTILLVSGSLVLDVVKTIKARSKHARETRKTRKAATMPTDPVVNGPGSTIS